MKYILGKSMQEKSLDVLEHFTMTLLVEGAAEADAGDLARRFPYLRMTRLKDSDWLVSMNSRTLVELWKDPAGRGFAGQVADELDRLCICPIFNEVAFGERIRAS